MIDEISWRSGYGEAIRRMAAGEDTDEQHAWDSVSEAVKNSLPERMCMDIAPCHVAACVPPDKDGIMHTPWCHLEAGHAGPHRCGNLRWMPGDGHGGE